MGVFVFGRGRSATRPEVMRFFYLVACRLSSSVEFPQPSGDLTVARPTGTRGRAGRRSSASDRAPQQRRRPRRRDVGHCQESDGRATQDTAGSSRSLFGIRLVADHVRRRAGRSGPRARRSDQIDEAEQEHCRDRTNVTVTAYRRPAERQSYRLRPANRAGFTSGSPEHSPTGDAVAINARGLPTRSGGARATAISTRVKSRSWRWARHNAHGSSLGVRRCALSNGEGE
jgi:hypothetical protein